MNARFFKDSITVFHKSNNSYSKYKIDKVYFRHNKKISKIDKGVENASAGTIVIPVGIALMKNEKLSDIKDILSEKDYIINGDVEIQNFDLKLLLQEYSVFKVLSVDDNRKGGLPHFKIGVNE